MLTTLEGDFSYFFYLEINPCPPFLLNSIRKTPTKNYEMRCWKVWCSIFLHYCCHSHARKGFAFFASFSKKYWRDVIISFISGVSFQYLNRYSEWMVLLDLRFFLQSESFLPCILNLNFSCMISISIQALLCSKYLFELFCMRVFPMQSCTFCL